MSTKKKYSDVLKKEIGDRFQAFRVANGYSRQQIADTIGVTVSAISNMETGKNIFGIDSLILLTKSYEINLHKLLTGVKQNQQESYISKDTDTKNIEGVEKINTLAPSLDEQVNFLHKEIEMRDKLISLLEKEIERLKIGEGKKEVKPQKIKSSQ